MIRFRVDVLDPDTGKCILIGLSDYADVAELIKRTIEVKRPELKPRVLDCMPKDMFFDKGDTRGTDF